MTNYVIFILACIRWQPFFLANWCCRNFLFPSLSSKKNYGKSYRHAKILGFAWSMLFTWVILIIIIILLLINLRIFQFTCFCYKNGFWLLSWLDLKWFVLNFPMWETEFFFLKSRNLSSFELKRHSCSFVVILVQRKNHNNNISLYVDIMV